MISEMKGTVSVVVPVYNVEKYLKRCIDSIVNQTYKFLDIILVDDGSRDDSGAICEEYKERFNNIRVIHQENQGLSSARNIGLTMARGEYITFIDSDDWIASDMIQKMLHLIKENDAEIAVTGFYQAYEGGQLVKSTSKTEVQVYSNQEALECFLFNEYLTPCVCGKLWQRDIWEGIECPVGRLFEDQYTTYKLLDKAGKVVFSPVPQYYYYKREDSIGHAPFNKKTYELYDGIQEEYYAITKKYPQIENNLMVARITWEIVFINMMLRSDLKDDELISKTRKLARARIIDVYKCCFISEVRKVQITLFAYCFNFYKLLYIKYKEKNVLS